MTKKLIYDVSEHSGLFGVTSQKGSIISCRLYTRLGALRSIELLKDGVHPDDINGNGVFDEGRRIDG